MSRTSLVGDKWKLKCIFYHVICIRHSQEENDERRWGFPQPNAIIEFFARFHQKRWNVLQSVISGGEETRRRRVMILFVISDKDATLWHWRKSAEISLTKTFSCWLTRLDRDEMEKSLAEKWVKWRQVFITEPTWACLTPAGEWRQCSVHISLLVERKRSIFTFFYFISLLVQSFLQHDAMIFAMDHCLHVTLSALSRINLIFFSTRKVVLSSFQLFPIMLCSCPLIFLSATRRDSHTACCNKSFKLRAKWTRWLQHRHDWIVWSELGGCVTWRLTRSFNVHSRVEVRGKTSHTPETTTTSIDKTTSVSKTFKHRRRRQQCEQKSFVRKKRITQQPSAHGFTLIYIDWNASPIN